MTAEMVDQLPPLPVEKLPGYVLAQTYRILRHAMDDALRDVGLTTPQWGTLSCIASGDGMSGADVARFHRLTPQTTNTILHNLEHADLIRRRRHPDHGTVLLIELTEAGHERLAEADRRVRSVHERMLGTISPSEQATLISLLTRCTAAFGPDAEALCPEE